MTIIIAVTKVPVRELDKKPVNWHLQLPIIDFYMHG